MASADVQTWTTRSLLAWMSDAFARADLDSPRLSAELIVSHVIGCERLKLYMDPDRPATPLERERLRDLTGRALRNEPVQYLVGEAWFFSLGFRSDPRALIPRPSTETLVETVLQHARAVAGFERAQIADVCTGSGCIAISLLRNLPEARAVGIDISPEALALAEENATLHHVSDRLDLIQGNLLEALADHPTGRQVHYLVSNPPYIPDAEWEEVEPNVRDFEPELALRGGRDGLQFVRPIIECGPERVRPGGLLIVEIASATADAALELARAHPLLADERIEEDLEGLPRALVATRAG